MGASKSDFFSEEQNELTSLFKALSHPARVAIIEYLLKVDTCICGDIVNELPLAQPTVSQHLKELKNANIIIRKHRRHINLLLHQFGNLAEVRKLLLSN